MVTTIFVSQFQFSLHKATSLIRPHVNDDFKSGWSFECICQPFLLSNLVDVDSNNFYFLARLDQKDSRGHRSLPLQGRGPEQDGHRRLPRREE